MASRAGAVGECHRWVLAKAGLKVVRTHGAAMVQWVRHGQCSGGEPKIIRIKDDQKLWQPAPITIADEPPIDASAGCLCI
mmetsp:Transcript_32173/g.69540  ORF Transcript_32173/g.69540 Transcript_32173/m.69540 type:complete len:80 (-) Transcript_32173:37-276(-)